MPHSVHRVLSICGIRDASASIRGSTHLVNVTKCVIQMLHGGVSRFTFLLYLTPSSRQLLCGSLVS